MSVTLSRRALCSGLAASAFAHAPAFAEDFPARPITMIVPFTAGGAGDILARVLSQRLEPIWGKGFVVENRPGAGGVIGAVATAKAPADGYTLMIAPSSTMAVNVSLYKTLPYNPATDFIPLAIPARTTFILVVNNNLPVKSVSELIAYAKAQKEPLAYATAGPGVPHHLFAELFKSMTGINMQQVPYKGSLPALQDVIAGHVPLMFVDLGPGAQQIKAGQVRPLGVSTAQRLKELPDVPAINETLPGFDVASWQMISAPAGTPRAVVEKLHRDIAAVMRDPALQEQIDKTGMSPVPSPSLDELQAYVKSEISRWTDVVRKAGIEGTM
jgi:tripartite-type tricarboxylate transporter receptor subunit TctC